MQFHFKRCERAKDRKKPAARKRAIPDQTSAIGERARIAKEPAPMKRAVSTKEPKAKERAVPN